MTTSGLCFRSPAVLRKTVSLSVWLPLIASCVLLCNRVNLLLFYGLAEVFLSNPRRPISSSRRASYLSRSAFLMFLCSAQMPSIWVRFGVCTRDSLLFGPTPGVGAGILSSMLDAVVQHTPADLARSDAVFRQP